jgi:4-hydroxy-2-oxoheptanedioate aldolase
VAFSNPILDRWRSGGSTLGAWLQLRDPFVAEMLASCGYDVIVVDQQHGLAGVADLPGLFTAIAAGGSVPVTRVPSRDPAEIGRALDLGALGVIVPMVNTAEEAALAVASCRYAPQGGRSYGPTRARMLFGTAHPVPLEGAAVILQVETAEGLANAASIAATPGVDAILIGPFDLALSMGLTADPAARPAAEAARHAAAVDEVRRACDDAGVAPGIYCLDGAAARAAIGQGFRLVTALTDTDAILAAGRRELAAARGA